jgi:hypothetical protein
VQERKVAELEEGDDAPEAFVAKLTTIFEGSISKLNGYAERIESAEIKKLVTAKVEELLSKDGMHGKLKLKSAAKRLKHQKSGILHIIGDIPRSKLNFQNISNGPTGNITISSLLLIIAIFCGVCYRAYERDMVVEKLLPAINLQGRLMHAVFWVFGWLLKFLGVKEEDWAPEELFPGDWIVVPRSY